MKDDLLGEEYVAKIKIEQNIKGDYDGLDIEINYYPDFSPDPDFMVEKRSVLFIRVWKERYRIVQGYRGLVEINNDIVNSSNILNEPEKEPLNAFIDKIKGHKKVK